MKTKITTSAIIIFFLCGLLWIPVLLGMNAPKRECQPAEFPNLKGPYLGQKPPGDIRVSRLNVKPVPDGPGNIYWVDAKIIEDL